VCHFAPYVLLQLSAFLSLTMKYELVVYFCIAESDKKITILDLAVTCYTHTQTAAQMYNNIWQYIHNNHLRCGAPINHWDYSNYRIISSLNSQLSLSWCTGVINYLIPHQSSSRLPSPSAHLCQLPVTQVYTATACSVLLAS